ncbi:MAG TPA: hypothetical protein VEN99_10955 [Acidimicrobiia bacterium]|nr:hypothetical protein [Acidimicrobiia bacterium]
MSPFEDFITEVEVRIIDSVDSMDDDDAALLYAGVLNVEQRLDALRDALTLLATAQA